MRKFSALLLVVWYSLPILTAQNVKEDLAKLNANYTANEFYAELEYKFYSKNTLVEEYNATHLNSKGDYYFKIKDIEIVNNNNCQLMVDHFSKSIAVMPSGTQKNIEKATRMPIDTALKGVSKYIYKKVSDKIGMYSFSLKKGEYKTVEIYFNTASYTVTKLKMYVSDSYAAQDPDLIGGILEVIYKTFKKSIPANKTHLLSEKTFVKIKKEAVVSVPAYTKYEINNYLNIKPE